jgi:signal transduction histidine kinase
MLDNFINYEPRNTVGEREDIDSKMDFDVNLDGVYTFTIENSKIISTSDRTNNETLEQYAIEISNRNTENGIIGDYIYKVRRTKSNNTIILMENKMVVSQTKLILLFSVLGCAISLIIIYSIAKKISKVIVKPIQETFEKQKQFISDASHELKTPLAVIEANTDVLENEIGNNKWMSYIQNEIESMNKLINELLLLAKIENVNELKDYKDFDISKETEIIISMFESMAYEKNVVLKSDIQEGIIINGNKEDIEHIVSTLVDNAIKHTESSKEIIVELNKDKNNAILKVKNMGNPIPEKEREKIFERFYRIDKSRNRSEKRYGLGLAIAKSTVQKYNGNIEVSYKNGFTIFKVTIPV